MRTIKFRAWNKKYEEMYSWDELLEKLEGWTKESLNISHHFYTPLFLSIVTDPVIWELYELRQFTWLYDSKWKEVFEGDIVNFRSLAKKDIRTGWIEYYSYSGNWYCRQSIIIKRNYYSAWEWHVESLNIENESEIEIIWNIYENPELLSKI